MTTKKASGVQGPSRPTRSTSAGKPRSFGEQWTSKGDAFTRTVSKTGHWSTKTTKPKQAS